MRDYEGLSNLGGLMQFIWALLEVALYFRSCYLLSTFQRAFNSFIFEVDVVVILDKVFVRLLWATRTRSTLDFETLHWLQEFILNKEGWKVCNLAVVIGAFFERTFVVSFNAANWTKVSATSIALHRHIGRAFTVRTIVCFSDIRINELSFLEHVLCLVVIFVYQSSNLVSIEALRFIRRHSLRFHFSNLKNKNYY